MDLAALLFITRLNRYTNLVGPVLSSHSISQLDLRSALGEQKIVELPVTFKVCPGLLPSGSGFVGIINMKENEVNLRDVRAEFEY